MGRWLWRRRQRLSYSDNDRDQRSYANHLSYSDTGEDTYSHHLSHSDAGENAYSHHLPYSDIDDDRHTHKDCDSYRNRDSDDNRHGD